MNGTYRMFSCILITVLSLMGVQPTWIGNYYLKAQYILNFVSDVGKT